MSNIKTIELFILKCAVIESENRRIRSDTNPEYNERNGGLDDKTLESYIKQFDLENRNNAIRMSQYYKIFYMLENDIRKLVVETLELAHGSEWWDKCASTLIKEEVKKNRTREENAAISLRSANEIDYTTFGQLGDLIRDNWKDFAGMMRNQSSVSRVMTALNMLRGTIAHCGVLAEDEADRLEITIRDWFRVLEGPK